MRSSGSSSELRSELRVINRADGSASFCDRATVIWAAVYGPADCQPSKRLHDRAALQVVCKSSSSREEPNCRLELLLTAACRNTLLLRQFPRCQFLIVTQEMQIDGSAVSAALNAACLALLDASAPLQGLFCGVTVCLSEEGELAAQPDRKTLAESRVIFEFALLKFGSAEVKISGSFTCGGPFQPSDYRDALELAKRTSASIFDFYRHAMERKFASEPC